MQDVTASRSPQGTGRNDERLAAMVGGAALVALAARDRSWRSLGLAIASAPFLWRGATGRWPALPQSVADRIPEVHIPSIDVSLTVNRPRQEVYAFWRHLDNLPRFMRHLESVAETGNGRSHWVGKPFGAKVEWDAQLVEDREGQSLAWRSLPDSEVDTSGSVHFTESAGGRGTVVRVHLEVDPHGGRVGRALGKLLSPITKHQVHEDLRRFKSLLEAGEIPTTAGQPSGHRSTINPQNPL